MKIRREVVRGGIESVKSRVVQECMTQTRRLGRGKGEPPGGDDEKPQSRGAPQADYSRGVPQSNTNRSGLRKQTPAVLREAPLTWAFLPLPAAPIVNCSSRLVRNAFVPAPSCTPCRSALLSGRYFFNTGRGAILQGAIWDDAIPTFPLLQRDHGYDIGKLAKVWGPGMPADAPFGKQQYAIKKSGMGLNRFSSEASRLLKEGKTFDEARSALLAQVTGNFDSFLKSRDPRKPFLFWFGPTKPHRQWVKGSGKALWSIDTESLRGKMPKFLPDVPEVREDFADYLGEAEAFDAYIGVPLKQLQEAGELDKTIVVISGDHGMPGVPGGKCNLYDFGTGRAPS